jgi:hypothetical protein
MDDGESAVRIVRKSPFTGKVHEMELPITEEQLRKWQDGELIQRVFPHLSPDQRGFIMTGITPEEWRDTFSETEE